jgi:hypothetical protein
MEADLLHQRVSTAARQQHEFTLLLRGAHRLTVSAGSVESSEGGGQTRFDITGSIAIDGSPPQNGTVSVTSDDVASIFVKDS